MQPNFAQKNRSSIIRLTEVAKKKARHRLIGSIFMLLIALVILLNVTARIKPIAINPEVIELKGSLRQVVPGSASAPAIATINNTQASSLNTVSASQGYTQNVVKANASALSQVIAVNASESSANQIESIVFKARVVGDKPDTKLSPEDILAGKTSEQTRSSHYFIQLIGLENRSKIVRIQQELNKSNIDTTIQAIQTPTGQMVYRLRMGPFPSQSAATTRLTELSHQGKLVINLSN